MEIVIATAIFCGIVFLTMSVNMMVQKNAARLSKGVDAQLDLALLDRDLSADLDSITPSLGNLKVKDLNGNDFFEYFGGPTSPNSPNANRETVLELSATGTMVFEFIMELATAGSARNFAPAQAYSYALNPGSLITPASLSYNGVNAKSFFTNHFSNHWEAKGHFLLYSPGLVPDLASGKPIEDAPSRFYSILGISTGTDLTPDTLSGLFNDSHPTITGKTIRSIDEYLRFLPALGGAMTQVVVVPVQVVRYRFEPDQSGVTGRLFRGVRSANGYEQERLIGANIRQVRFRRPRVSSRRLEFQIQLGGATN